MEKSSRKSYLCGYECHARARQRMRRAMTAHTSMLHVRVIRSLDQVIEWRGKPLKIRCDNGPEYVSEALKEWAERRGIALQFIQPGKPQQNAYIERYNRTVRYDWLAHYLFETVSEVQDYATKWLWSYNYERPNMPSAAYRQNRSWPSRPSLYL